MKWVLLSVISVIALGATAVFGIIAFQQSQERNNAPSVVETAPAVPVDSAGRIVFRNTAAGQGYGHIASVPQDDPSGPRALMDVACDRVYATVTSIVCLRTERGIAPSFVAQLLDSAGTETQSWPLPGIPSRTRISPDGTLIATTSFVTGHSYATVGFSTETVIRGTDGTNYGNLEDFTLAIDGAPVTSLDRNFWGVTFIDDQSFYATASANGRTWLVRGDLESRSLTSVIESVECPSLSPDGTRVAFKRVTGTDGTIAHWTPAILDLATGEVTLLPETRSIDDQIEWLDDSTIMYGMPRESTPGDTDVWALKTDGSDTPRVFIEHAWSPSVVRSAK